jgi:hypothetical protein
VLVRGSDGLVDFLSDGLVSSLVVAVSQGEFFIDS